MIPDSPKRQLGVFAKYWSPGAVKTRLAKTEGATPAAELYKAFLQTTLRRFSRTPCHRVLAYTPEERSSDFREMAGVEWQLQRQADGDLGHRIEHYFQSAFGDGQDQVVLIGSDSPNLPVDIVQTAFRSLEDKPVVLGPTTDGGYYLVGATSQSPDIFVGIDWSSDHVWHQTIQRLQSTSLGFAELPVWYDIDNRADLDCLSKDLAKTRASDPHLDWLRNRIEFIRTSQ